MALMLQQKLYRAYEGQSLYDVAAAEYGNASLAIDLAIFNGLSVTDALAAGQVILLIDAKKEDNVLAVYSNSGIIPATAKSNNPLVKLDGIGYMKIGTTFRIS